MPAVNLPRQQLPCLFASNFLLALALMGGNGKGGKGDRRARQNSQGRGRGAGRELSPAARGGATQAHTQRHFVSQLLIPETDVAVDEGPEGLLGQGASGEVRRGTFRGEAVALKSNEITHSRDVVLARRN